VILEGRWSMWIPLYEKELEAEVNCLICKHVGRDGRIFMIIASQLPGIVL
jgi:hypothetical protein